MQFKSIILAPNQPSEVVQYAKFIRQATRQQLSEVSRARRHYMQSEYEMEAQQLARTTVATLATKGYGRGANNNGQATKSTTA